MKLKLTLGLIVLALIGVAILVERLGESSEGGFTSVSGPVVSQSSVAQLVKVAHAEIGVAASSDASQSSSSSGVSSVASSLSYPRVDPAQEIKQFLDDMDETAVPKINARDVKRDELFDYSQATPEQLKARALAGDAYAALDYANYLRFNKLRIKSERGAYIYNPDRNARDEAMKEIREFLVRAVNGGLSAGGILLSREYSNLLYYRVESLAWRKVAFAMGESENFDCLRDSTSCVVKDFNNLNRDEFFYPCVARALNFCTKADQEDAALLALQYLNSFEFAISNVHRGVGR